MVELFDAYKLSVTRYMSLRALVLAAFKAALLPDSQGDIWASKEVADSLLPFCRFRKGCFKTIEGALFFLKPYANLFLSPAHLDFVLPEAFAGCLHETATLIGRLPFLEKLVHAMKDALRLWCRGGNLWQYQAARAKVLEASAAATGSSSGTSFGHAEYLRRAVSEYLLRTSAITATSKIFIASLEEAAVSSSHQWAEEDSEPEAVTADSLPLGKRVRGMPLVARDCIPECQGQHAVFSAVLADLQHLHPRLSTLAAALSEMTHVDTGALKFYCATMAMRLYMWDNYRRGHSHWDITAMSAVAGLSFDMTKRRVDVPFRLLNRASVWLFLVGRACLHQLGDTAAGFLAVVFNVICFRSGWNSEEHHRAAVVAFGALGGLVVTCPTYGPIAFAFAPTFQWDLFRQVSRQHRHCSSAYRSGTFGCAAAADILDAWTDRLRDVVVPPLLASLDWIVGFLSKGPADKEMSFTMMVFCQRLLGNFVGYQVVLDVGYLYPCLFNEATAVHVGPGAMSGLKCIFVNAPWSSTGMEYSSTASRSALPFINELHCIMEDHPEARVIRTCCEELGLYPPSINDVQYHLCEARQLAHNRVYLGYEKAPGWYQECIRRAAFQRAVRWQPTLD